MRCDMEVMRCLCGLLLLLLVAPVGAGKVETLVMPGPVSSKRDLASTVSLVELMAEQERSPARISLML